MDQRRARYVWQLIEPYHSVIYFDPDALAISAGAGFKGGWMGYFAGRAGAMGAVSAAVVTATFYNFHPEMVARSIPDAWRFSTPEKALAARIEIARRGLERALGTDPDLGETPALLARVVEAGDPAGRPLFAANAALERPDSPTLDLWWACTALREHRGDGHVACLTRAGIDGCEAHVLSAAIGAVEPTTQQRFRGWSQQDWSEASVRLHARGLVHHDGSLTDEGAELKQQIEDDTDRLAAAPYEVLTEEEIGRAVGTLERLVVPLLEGLRYPNPMGLTRPERPA